MASWFVTTNNRASMLVEPGDRRFCFLDCADTRCGAAHTVYWHNLAQLLFHTKDSPRAVYQFLMGLDISKYRKNFFKMRPLSQTHEAAAQSGIPDFGKYLSYLCGVMEGSGARDCINTAMGMVADFKEWLGKMNFSTRQQDKNTGPDFLDAMKSFSLEASNTAATKGACQYKRRSTGFSFVLNAAQLKILLKRTSRFHQNLYEMGGGDECMYGGKFPIDDSNS